MHRMYIHIHRLNIHNNNGQRDRDSKCLKCVFKLFFSRLNGRFITEHRAQHLSREPQMGMYLTPQTSGMSCFSVTMFLNSSALNLKSHFCGMWILWQPGNLALSTQSLNYMFLILQLGMNGHDSLANVNLGVTVPWVFTKAPYTPVWSISAPAKDNI